MFQDEFMVGIDAGAGDFISKLSIYAIEDSGHYLGIYDNVPDLVLGKGKGCAYLNNLCDYTQFPDEFCDPNATNAKRCHYSTQGSAVCFKLNT